MNSAVSATLKLSPFQVNYGRLPTLMNLPKGELSTFPGINKFAENARMNVQMAHDAIIAGRVDQTEYANRKRREDPPLKVGDRAYVSTSDMNLPKGRARKLMPKYIGPYEIIRVNAGTLLYELRLPPELERCRIHPTFHVSKLRPHVANDDD